MDWLADGVSRRLSSFALTAAVVMGAATSASATAIRAGLGKTVLGEWLASSQMGQEQRCMVSS